MSREVNDNYRNLKLATLAILRFSASPEEIQKTIDKLNTVFPVSVEERQELWEELLAQL